MGRTYDSQLGASRPQTRVHGSNKCPCPWPNTEFITVRDNRAGADFSTQQPHVTMPSVHYQLAVTKAIVLVAFGHTCPHSGLAGTSQTLWPSREQPGHRQSHSSSLGCGPFSISFGLGIPALCLLRRLLACAQLPTCPSNRVRNSPDQPRQQRSRFRPDGTRSQATSARP